jgi:hypothetical protein
LDLRGVKIIGLNQIPESWRQHLAIWDETITQGLIN